MTAPAWKLITCVLPPGIATELLRKLRSERGISEANAHTARGIGKLTPAAYRQLGNETQKEIVSVVVPSDRADELFRYVFTEAQIDRPHGGIMFMHVLGRATPLRLPDLPEET